MSETESKDLATEISEIAKDLFKRNVEVSVALKLETLATRVGTIEFVLKGLQK